MKVKALSIRQPWAWLIANGFKDIENRSWPSRYTGTLLVHASKGMTAREYDDVAAMLGADPRLSHIRLPARERLERGGIVGVAHCSGSVNQSDSPWFFGPYGFPLTQQRAFQMIPYKGRLGFFDVPHELIADAIKEAG